METSTPRATIDTRFQTFRAAEDMGMGNCERSLPAQKAYTFDNWHQRTSPEPRASSLRSTCYWETQVAEYEV